MKLLYREQGIKMLSQFLVSEEYRLPLTAWGRLQFTLGRTHRFPQFSKSPVLERLAIDTYRQMNGANSGDQSLKKPLLCKGTIRYLARGT